MSNTRASKGASLLLAFLAAGLLATSLTLPLWQLRMEAPQYRDEEALRVAVYPNALRGDINEITVLNQYIGVHIPENLPQLHWLPAALLAAGTLGFAVALFSNRVRRYGLVIVPALLSVVLVMAAVQAQRQMYDIGHKRDHKTKLVGVKDFTTPLVGHARIAQFDVTSNFGAGAYLIGAAVLLQLGGAWISRRRTATPFQNPACASNPNLGRIPCPACEQS